MPLSEDTKKKAKQAKMRRVMHEFKVGSLKSSDGETVTDRDQAEAIALSEIRRKYGA